MHEREIHYQTFENSTAEEINENIFKLLVPNIIIVGIYIFIGIVGNGVVFYIYRFRMRDTTDNRFFIPCLAAGDMLATVACGTSAILLYVFQTNFRDVNICKILWFSMTWTVSIAAFILVFIAFQRYKKICKPLEDSKLLERKWSVVIVLFISAILLSLPLLFISGISKYEIKQTNTTLYICERIGNEWRQGLKLHIAYVYTGIETSVGLIVSSLLTTLYMKVGIQLFLHFKSKYKRSNKSKVHVQTNEQESTCMSDMETSKTSELKSPHTIRKNRTPTTLKRKKRSFNNRHRYTFIFIAISVICIVTYSPRLLLMVIETVDDTLWIDYYNNTLMTRVLRLLNRFHLVNNITNPFLYTMFDQKFKTQLSRLIRCYKNST